MAVMKQQYKYGITYEYRAGQYVKMQCNGITICVYKPYRLKRYSEYVFKGPKITLAANPTAILNIQDIRLIQECVEFGINLLNKEGINLIDVNNWLNDYEYERINESSVIDVTKPKHKWYKPEINDLFHDGKGHNYIYIGKGTVYGYDSWDINGLKNGRKVSLHDLNYLDCDYCYIELGEDNIKTIQNNANKLELKVPGAKITSSKNAKKAYEIIKSFPRDIHKYIFRDSQNKIAEQYMVMLEGNYLNAEAITKILKRDRREDGVLW